MSHQYAFDAARLLDRCLFELDQVVRASSHSWFSSSTSLQGLQKSMTATEDLLLEYFQQLLEYERLDGSSSPRSIQELYSSSGGTTLSLSSAVDILRKVLDAKQRERKKQNEHEKEKYSCYSSVRNATDSLLFRLVVSLQLCLLRISDGHLVVTGRRRINQAFDLKPSQFSTTAGLSLAVTSSLGISAYWFLARNRQVKSFLGLECRPLVFAGVGAMTLNCLRVGWSNVWMSTKINKSAKSLDEWNRQWRLIQSTTSSQTDLHALSGSGLNNPSLYSLREKQSQRLIEDALRNPPKSCLLQSHGELRFLLLKNAMDIFYASVGTAMKVAKGRSEPDWQLSLVTAAAASFYSLTGASRRAAEVTSSSRTACQLIQNAWGMVSRPAVKNISLQASRLIKGAAVADRIEVNGVSCFVLSAAPVPELAAAIESFKRKHKRNTIPTLSTIDEQEEHAPCTNRASVSKPFARSKSNQSQRDVIFHLTGGGFFSHIIASDLPYLLDWSASTGAVVLCPEYGLLPEHAFPYALNQVVEVYRALAQGDTVSTLGFEVSGIVVSGESAGGNLGAALCVKLSQDEEERESGVNGDTANGGTKSSHSVAYMPDALMLSCPVLDLSLELSHSRVLGTNDPVLPSGLISAISDAYVPPRLGVSKKNPLASPIYASDATLRKFPPTLLIASSNDPLLDDSVAFNQRLRSLGIESELRAAENMPHAYLGLGTAGFPEAVQVQQECQRWLAFQLTRVREDTGMSDGVSSNGY